MPTTYPHMRQSRNGSILVKSLWGAGFICVPLVAIGLAVVLPDMVALPVLAAIAVIAGFTLEVLRRLARSSAPESSMRLREIAAGLVLFGFATTILADGDKAATAFDTHSQPGVSSTVR